MERAKLTVNINGPTILPALARLTALDGLLSFTASERTKASKSEYSIEDVVECVNSLPIEKSTV